MSPEALTVVRFAYAALGGSLLVLGAVVFYLWSTVDRLRERVARLEGAAGHSPESSPPRPR